MLRFCKAIRPMAGFHVDQPPTNSRYTQRSCSPRCVTMAASYTRCVLGCNDTVEAEFSLGEYYDFYTIDKFPFFL